MDYISIRNAILDDDTEGLCTQLAHIPRESLAEAWNCVVSLLSYSQLAVSAGMLKVMLQTFLRAGMNVDDMDSCGNSLFTHAVSNKLTTVVDVLMKAGATMNALLKDSRDSLLGLALREGDLSKARRLAMYGVHLNETELTWHRGLFEGVIRVNDVTLLGFLLDQFEQSKHAVPWREILTVCVEKESPQCANIVLQRDYMKRDLNDSPTCPYLWCVNVVGSMGNEDLVKILVCKHPRLLHSGLVEGNLAIERYHAMAHNDNSLAKYLDAISSRCNKLDERGPQLEILVYGRAYNEPAPLRMFCRATILHGLLPNPRTKIQHLPLPKVLKSYLCESTNQTVLNIDYDIRQNLYKYDLSLEILCLVSDEVHVNRCFCNRRRFAPNDTAILETSEENESIVERNSNH